MTSWKNRLAQFSKVTISSLCPRRDPTWSWRTTKTYNVLWKPRCIQESRDECKWLHASTDESSLFSKCWKAHYRYVKGCKLITLTNYGVCELYQPAFEAPFMNGKRPDRIVNDNKKLSCVVGTEQRSSQRKHDRACLNPPNYCLIVMDCTGQSVSGFHTLFFD